MSVRTVLACAGMVISASVLSACSDGGLGAFGGDGGGDANAPRIEPFLWADRPAYCAFLPSGTKFNPGDKSTWEFVFVTTPKPGLPVAASPAVMQIDGEQVILSRNLMAPGSDLQTWVYREDGSMLEVELKLEQPAADVGGVTHGPQNATLRVRGPVKGPAKEVRGGCGL